MQKIHVLSGLDDVLALPDPNSTPTTSSWVFNSDDKVSSGLYPLGFEVHPAVEPKRNSPVRHSSFSVPRYARVHQRPQRALSFAATRNPFSLHDVAKVMPRPLPVSTPHLTGARKREERPVLKGVATLSKKYSAFSQRSDTNFSVIEVGSLKSVASKGNQANDRSTESSHPKGSSKIDELSESIEQSAKKGKKADVAPPKPQRIKGPAPPPPIKSTQDVLDVTKNLKIDKLKLKKEGETNESTANHSEDSTSQASDVSNKTERYCSCSEACVEFEEIEENDSTISYESHLNRAYAEKSAHTSCLSGKKENERISEGLAKKPVLKTPPPSDLLKPPRLSLHKKGGETSAGESEPKLEDAKRTLKAVFDPSERQRNQGKNCERLLSLFHDQTKEYFLQSFNLKPSKYKTVHREIIKESKTLLDELPYNELQKNKIVLRVPSFRTTGCQTESYRPIRRRATCSQDNLSPASRYLSTGNGQRKVPWKPTRRQEVQNDSNPGSSSSSSGYSSPEASSKHNSPVHSGPPSPGSCYESGIEDHSDRHGPNITIIEICRHSPRMISSQNRSDATLVTNLMPTVIPENTFHVPVNKEEFCLPELKDNLLKDTSWTPPLRDDYKIPRIVNAIRKEPRQKEDDYECIFKTFATANETAPNRDAQPQRTNSLSLPRVSNAKINRTSSNIYYSNAENADIDSTAAYLASLELLASHYRQQALANAKVRFKFCYLPKEFPNHVTMLVTCVSGVDECSMMCFFLTKTNEILRKV